MTNRKCKASQTHNHILCKMDGMGYLNLTTCLETSTSMELVFTKHWITALQTSNWYEVCQIKHPLIKSLKK